MFVFVNSLAFPVITKLYPNNNLVQFSSSVEYVLSGFSAVIFGFLADSKGRKRLAVLGFALLGLGYGILGFSPQGNLYGWWFYTAVDGIAWGSLVTLFVFTLWGDLAEGQSSEKIYAIGVMPYLASAFMRYSIGSILGTAFIPAMIFSYASFFLFVAVFPLLLAPETLSEQLIKNNDLRNYVMKAQRQVSKIQDKQKKHPNDDKEEEDKEPEVETVVEYEEACKIAEEYY